MTKIELERYGHILSGFYEGYFVKIHDDSDIAGGYQILLVNDLSNPTDGGDYWVEGVVALESFVESSRWTIEWNE